MFNILKIDFNNTQEGNISFPDVSSEKVGYSSSFEDILKGQLRDVVKNNDQSIKNEDMSMRRELNDAQAISDKGKNSIKENESSDNSLQSEKLKNEKAEDNQNDESTIRKSLKNEEKKADEISKDEEKNKQIDENNHKIGDNAESLREKILLLSECLHLLQNITKQMPKDEGNIGDIKQIILKLQDIINSKELNTKDIDKKNIDVLLTKLKSILKRLNLANHDAIQKNKNDAGLTVKLADPSELKDEIANLLKSIKQYLGKRGRVEISKNIENSDSDPKDIKNAAVDKHFNPTFNSESCLC